MAVTGWILIGLIVGAVARLVVPGRRPVGLRMTLVLGIIGAATGGLIASAVWPIPDGESPPAAERAPCAVVPPEHLWKLMLAAVWPTSGSNPDPSQLWPGLLTSITCAVLVLLVYFALAGRRTTLPDHDRQTSRGGPRLDPTV